MPVSYYRLRRASSTTVRMASITKSGCSSWLFFLNEVAAAFRKVEARVYATKRVTHEHVRRRQTDSGEQSAPVVHAVPTRARDSGWLRGFAPPTTGAVVQEHTGERRHGLWSWPPTL